VKSKAGLCWGPQNIRSDNLWHIFQAGSCVQEVSGLVSLLSQFKNSNQILGPWLFLKEKECHCHCQRRRKLKLSVLKRRIAES
jgi:hypothetical protein